MILDTCLVSTDLTPNYVDCLPLVYDVWRDIAGIRCVVALVADAVPSLMARIRDDVILFPELPDVSNAFQTQCVRLLAPQLLPNAKSVILSDIDMLPMQKRYFVDSVKGVADDAFVVYRSDALPGKREIAICYNAAAPTTWAELVEPVASVDEAQRIIKEWAKVVHYNGTSGGAGWSTDQELLFEFVSRLAPSRIVRFTDAQLGHSRLDRSEMGRNGADPLQRYLASRGAYCDFHMQRPTEQYYRLNAEVAALAVKARSGASVANKPLLAVSKNIARVRRRALKSFA